MKALDKIKNFFGYSHPGNKKTIQSNLDKFIELLRYNSDILLKIVSDFRTAHMNIIAGMIAFLGLINKDGIQDDMHFKYGVIALLIFIAMSIITILMSFYYDAFSIKSTMKYLSKYVKISKESKDRVIKLELDKVVNEWYLNNAKEKFKIYGESVIKKFENLNVKPNKISIRKMNSRWGSCSKKGNITLNSDLIRAPRGCIEYVLTHECTHLLEFGHTKRFYEIQTSQMPDWEKWKNKLEKLLA